MNFPAQRVDVSSHIDASQADAGQSKHKRLARRYRLHKTWGVVSMIVTVLLMSISSTLLIIGAFIFASFAFLLMALEDSERQCTDAEIRAARLKAAKIAVERENTDLRVENLGLIQSALRGEAVALADNTERASANVIFINPRQPKGSA